MDSEAKALQTIARRILAQVCSISSCERNWSTYSFVHNKVRNHLHPSRAEDLVYIYTNIAAGSQFDGAGGSGGADLGVFDFCEGEDQPHATTPIPPVHDEPRDGPSIATFSVAENLRPAQHADFVVATNPTTNAVEHSHSASDSLDFGDAGEGGNIHQECNLGIVEPPD